MIKSKIEVYCKNLNKRIVDKINEYPEKIGLISVILTGSLGRDEGTFHALPDTSELILDSDVELALVYKNGKKKDAEKIKRKLIHDFKEEMNPMTISESRVRHGYNFNYSILPPPKSSIFMYDLYHGSKTIWGEELLNKEIPKYDKYEAKRIVANRIGELTYLKTTMTEDVEKLTRQWKGKLVLAIGSAYCILEKSYESKYGEQKDFIVSKKGELKDILGENFVEDYEKTYLFLRKNGEPYELSDTVLRNYVKQINILFSRSDLETPQINSFSRTLKYAIACVKAKAPFNPFTCEQDILNNLIYNYIFNNEDLVKLAKNWKKILY